MPDINLNKKQSLAFTYLNDDITTEVVFGGGVYGGKTWLLAVWVISNCIRYPGYVALVGRTVLTQLRLTTLKTIFEVLGVMDLKPEIHYKYNAQSNVITFNNGSEIILKDLQMRPGDPEFDSLGSLNLTSVSIDEGSQTSRTVYDVLKSRIRHKLSEFNLKPKILITTNPCNGFIKELFYKPWIENTLPENRKFVQSLLTDNPYLTEDYYNNLLTLPDRQRKRLLEGNWSYDDSTDSLFHFDTILSSFDRNYVNIEDKIYASLDVARLGSDNSVLIISRGLSIIEINVYSKLDTNQLYDKVKERLVWYNISNKSLVVDSDGIGGGVADLLRGVNFVNNSKPLYDQNYYNLKSQAYVTLSNKFKKNEISINIKDVDIKDRLTTELLAIKLKDVESDGKIGIISKEVMKKTLGFSPDISDALAMLMYFFIENTKNKPTGKYSLSLI